MRRHLAFAAAMALAPAAFTAAVYPDGFQDLIVASGLSSPTSMAFAPDGRIFVSQQVGVVSIVRNDQMLPNPLMALHTDYNTERGLLGIAVDPDFADNHYLYVYYTAYQPVSHNRLSRFTESGGAVDTSKETVLVDLPPLPAIKSVKSINFPGTTTQAVWHMGGAINFGPDGKIYLDVGEHQQPDSAQKLTNVFGKILRFNPDGSIPADNPFYASAPGLAKAIWAYGLRNPFTFAIQPKTGRMYANDVGESTWEEIDEIAKGANYGWTLSEGATKDARFTGPIYTYNHGEGHAIMGGAFYNPRVIRFPPEDTGQYFFMDFSGGWIRRLDPATDSVTNWASGILNPVGLKISPDGYMYYLVRGYGTGAIAMKSPKSQLVKVFNPSIAASIDPLAERPRAARGGLVNLDVTQSLAVPAGKTGLRLFDLSGRKVWEVSGLRGGERAVLPAGLARGALHFRWVASGG